MIEILILIILILLNGLFALSEIALVSSKRSRLEQKKIQGSNGATLALRLLDNSENFLSAIQVGITLIGIVTGVFGGTSIADDVAPFFANFQLTQEYAYQISLTLTIVVITYFTIVIGELVPKTIALSNPEKIAIVIAPLIYLFSTVFYPFVKLLSVSTKLVNKIIGIKKQTESITKADLIQMIKIAHTGGVIEKEQNIIHEKVFYFGDKRAKHIMTHRTDIEWIDIDKSFDSIKKTVYHAHHSKLICCSGNLDNFKGIIYLKDFYKQIAESEPFDISQIIFEPVIVPENVSAHKVLTLFREKKIYHCCVVNEYGGLEGIITLHDIVENIVGNLPEEGENEEADIFIREDNSFLVNGDAPIETLNEVIDDFHVDYDAISYSTVAGFVTDQIGQIPKVGESFQYMNYKVEIVDMDRAMVDKVLISKTSN
ncbi:MAG: hemolysin family protein [Bacteroidales bacterium]